MARIRRVNGEKASITPQIWRVGKYIRLSRDDGGSESESIINQRKILDEQIPSYFGREDIIVDEYIDDGRTGTSDDTRPDFLRLVEDVKRGRINCIITKNLSRAFRNSANQGKFLEEFIPLYNTRFISLYEPHLDTFLNPEVVHSLEVSITGFLNEQYAYKTSVDVRRTFETKRKKGEFIGAFAPYGLMKKPENKNSLMIDEDAAAVVRDIFRWFVEEGMSKAGIAKRLNELGIPNPTAYKHQKGLRYCGPQTFWNDGLWSEKTIRDILLNEMYIGNMVQGKQKVISYKVHDRVRTDEKDWIVVENTHDAIISKELFEKAQDLLQRDTRVPSEQRSLHLFSGLLRCADCKKSMTRKTSKGIVYYICSTYARKSKSACTQHTIREDVLEKVVLRIIQEQISLIENLEEIIEEVNRVPRICTEEKRLSHLLHDKQQELEKMVSITDTLYLDWRTGEISEADYRRMKEKCEIQRKQLTQTLVQLQAEQDALAQKKNSDETLNFQNIDRLNRGILVELIDRIEVREGGGLIIYFNYADPYRQILEILQDNSCFPNNNM